MNKKQYKTLLLIFEKPTRSDVRYEDLKALLASIGAKKGEGRGSRVRFEYSHFSVHIHKPHPKKVLPKYSVELVRDFLMEIGVTP
jgi:hypothetical protein